MSETLDGMTVIRTLGEGGFGKVKLVETPGGELYAAKILKKTAPSHLREAIASMHAETEVMSTINHLNVVRQFGCVEAGSYQGPNKQEEVAYMLLEFCEGGELFDVVAQTGAFEEPLARFYFGQILDGLEAIHDAGFAHRDLKPENLIMSSDLDIKISDFGFAIYLSGRDGSGILTSYKGTKTYMAPEIYDQQYVGSQVDLFAAGVILFTIVSQRPPHNQALNSDYFYRTFCTDNPTFWRKHMSGGSNYSPEFMDIINHMLSPNPSDRLSIPELRAHPWMQGHTFTKAEALQLLTERNGALERANQAAVQQAQGSKKQRGQQYRGGEEEEEEEDLFEQEEIPGEALANQVRFQARGNRKTTGFESALPASVLLDRAKTALEGLNATITEKRDKGKLKVVLSCDRGEELGAAEIEFVVQVSVTAEGTQMVEFFKKVGDTMAFQDLYKRLVLDSPAPLRSCMNV